LEQGRIETMDMVQKGWHGRL